MHVEINNHGKKIAIGIHFQLFSLLEIMLFATNHYATSMQLVVVYNYFNHICNYKFGIV
jgi:hypothetical protein